MPKLKPLSLHPLGLGVVIALVSGAAIAGEPYIFFGGALSSSSTRGAASSGSQALTSQGYRLAGDRDTSHGGLNFNIGAGYRLNRFFAAEAAYYDLGDVHKYSATYTRVVAGTVQSAGHVKNWHASARELALIGAWPLTPSASVIGKVSAIRLYGHFESVLECDAGCAPRSVDSRGSGTAPGLAIGASVRPEQKLEFRAMLESWRVKSGAFGTEGEDLRRINLISFRAAYVF